MIGRADIEGSKSNVAMNAWLPQASYPCGNFSGTSSWNFLKSKGSIGHAFAVYTHAENQNQQSFSPFSLREISDLTELYLGHLRYYFTDIPPQPNSPLYSVIHDNLHFAGIVLQLCICKIYSHGLSKTTLKAVVFQFSWHSHLFYILQVILQSKTKVKLNRVFFPRWLYQARSLGCSFAR